jgi:hypothetical protein
MQLLYRDFFLNVSNQQEKRLLKKKRKRRYKTGGGSKKNNKENSSSEFILSIINKKTVQGLTNEFDCDATLESAELEVNKIKVKCAFVKHFLFLFFHVDLKFEVTLTILTLMTLHKLYLRVMGQPERQSR